MNWPGVYKVRVGVSLARPPREDASVWVQVQADGEQEAELIACQIAMCDRRVVMAVSSEVVSCVL